MEQTRKNNEYIGYKSYLRTQLKTLGKEQLIYFNLKLLEGN